MRVDVMPSLRSLVVVALLLAASGRVLLSQGVRGVVLQPDGATPAQGIVVLVVSADNKLAGRALTTARGSFEVALPRAGSYTVRALRIGFRPTDVGPITLAGDSVHAMRVVLAGEPIALEAITVSGRPSCRNSGDNTGVAAAWLQARTALTAAAITAESDALVTRYASWERLVAPDDSLITWQRSHVGESNRPQVFVSAPADSLARVGYAFIADQQFTFLGPDAEVLLSDQFAATHCLRLAPTPDRDPARVAIEFEPAGRRGGYVDVRGRLILDRATSELRSLEFTYQGLPRGVNETHAGGRVIFDRVPDGAWIVSRWTLRVPAMNVTGDVQNLDRATATVKEVRESGGDVFQVTRDADVLWSGRERRIAGRVANASDDAPAQGGVYLDGTTSGMRLADGMFRFEDVIPGRYRLRGTSPQLDSLGLPTYLGTVDVRDSSMTSLALRLPSVEDVYREACRRQGEGALGATGLVRGFVTDAAGQPVAGATVRMQFMSADTVENRVIPRRGRNLLIETAQDGSFNHCGVPRGTRLKLAVVNGETSGEVVDALLARDRIFVIVQLRAPRPAQ